MARLCMLAQIHSLSLGRQTEVKAWGSLNSCLPHPSQSLVLKEEWGPSLQENTDLPDHVNHV